MQQVKKVVLAYSGGVDTSVCIPYLRNEYGVSEVVTIKAKVFNINKDSKFNFLIFPIIF